MGIPLTNTICSRCKLNKAPDQFFKCMARGKLSRQAYCRSCSREVARERYKAGKGKEREIGDTI